MPFSEIHPPLINASGILSYPEVFSRFERAGAALGGYVTKSVGPVEKEGNDNPVLAYPQYGDTILLNSLALPTQCPEDWIRDLAELKLERSRLIVSIYGGNAREFASLAERLSPYADAIELNLGCPNRVPGEHTIAETIGQQPILCGEITRLSRASTDKPIVAKLTPNSDYLSVAEACLEGGADALGCGNTLGPGLAIDITTRKPVLAGITGGISGAALKPINLRMTYEVFSRFACPIIAYGGISRWEDAVEYILAGACVLGIGSGFVGKGTEECSVLTREIWEGVLCYLDGAPFISLVGGAHRDSEEGLANV